MPLDQIDAFMQAISAQESSGNPTARNARTGAYGTFQIMPTNWSPWAMEAGLGANAERTPENQQAVARHKMKSYYEQFGSWEGVAIAWFAGPGAARAYMRGDRSVLNRSDGNMTVAQYVAKMRRGMESYLGGQGGDVLSRQAANRSQPVRTAAEQQTGTTLSPGGDPFQARAADPKQAFTAMLQAVADRTAGRTGANYAKGLEATPNDVDDGTGFTDLPGAKKGEQAIETVNAILDTYRKTQPEPAVAPAAEGAEPVTADEDSATTVTPTAGGQANERGIALVEAAKAFLGVDYVWGGTSPTGVDCSGLLLLAARELGISLPRVSRDQARAGVEVEGGVANAQPGDLIAFDAGKERGVVNHIGMIVGRDERGRLLMIHAPRTGKQVEIVAVTRNDVMNVRRLV